LKIKAQPSDLGWQSIATEHAGGEAKGFSLAEQAGPRAAWLGRV